MLLLGWIPQILVALGIVIMALNIRKYFTFARYLTSLRGRSQRHTKAILLLYISLLLSFLFGYIGIEVSMLAPDFAVNDLLVGLILFLGSIFVLLGILLQISLSNSIHRSNLEVTQALITAVEARDKNLNGHSVHVARLSLLIYSHLPKNRRQFINPTTLEYAALLHDIGKLGVPECILNKDGPLNEEEWAAIRQHPIIGKNILCTLQSFGEISDWVLYHHERCDGKGYCGLCLEEIPFPSLIIAVADTFSALTMTRSYRGSKSYEDAVAILEECRDTQLSGEVVDVFLSLSKTEVEACQVEASDLEECFISV